MKVVAISLPASLERRASVTQKLNDRNIEFEFIDAVDGRVDQHPYLKNYDEKSVLINRRRRAAPGELGCYVSHLLAWEKCVEVNEPSVVLEDDCELTDDFEAGIRYLEKFVDQISLVRIEPLVPHGVNPTYEDSIIGVDFRNYREKGAMLGFKRFAYKTFYALANLYTNLVNGLTRF